VTVTFADALGWSSRKPIFLIDLLGRGVRLSSGVVEGATDDYDVLIDEDKVSFGAVSVDPLEGITSIGSVTAILSDINRKVTDLFALQRKWMSGSEAVVKVGFQGINEAQYATTFRGFLSQFSVLQNHRGYRVVLNDAMTLFRRPVFRSATPSAPVTLIGNPLTVMMQVLASTGAGTNGPYDVLLEPNGLSVDHSSWVNEHAIESERAIWTPGVTYQYVICEPEDALTWVQQEICKPLGCYLMIGVDGKLAVRFVRPIQIPTDTITLTDAEIIGPVDYALDLDRQNFNEVLVRWDYDSTTKLYGSSATVKDYKLIARYGRTITKEITSQGLRTAYGGAAHAISIGNRLLSTFGQVQPQITIRSNLKGYSGALGGMILMSAKTMPESLFGANSVLAENVRPSYYHLLPRSGGHAPAGTADYSSQTPDQKLRYWSVCSIATSKMSNGDSGFAIGEDAGVVLTAETAGSTSIPVQVVSRHADIAAGVMTFRGLAIEAQSRTGYHALPMTPDYTIATVVAKGTFWFVASSVTGELSNGDKGYVIV